MNKEDIVILVGCEESQIVCKAFREAGFTAYSCDILPASGGHPEWHYQGDVFEAIEKYKPTLGIFHPPCTYFSLAGNSWYYHPEDKHLPTTERRPHPRFPNRKEKREESRKFFVKLAQANIPHKALENPMGTISSLYRKPDQYIHPYFFGDPHSKKTGLWLYNLPKLVRKDFETEPKFHIYKDGRKDPIWHFETMGLPEAERQCQRSKTFQGIADAMVDQWGSYLLEL